MALFPALAAQQPVDLRQDVDMVDRWRAPGGWTVEVVQLNGTPDHRDGEWLRVRLHGSWVADVGSPAELEQWFSLASLDLETLALVV